MKKMSGLIMFLALLCGQIIAMQQKKMISPTVMQVDRGPFTRTYEYENNRWKLKKEVRDLLRSSGQEEVTKKFTEDSQNPEMIRVEVSTKVMGPSGYQQGKDRYERITCADYEALDYKESNV